MGVGMYFFAMGSLLVVWRDIASGFILSVSVIFIFTLVALGLLAGEVEQRLAYTLWLDKLLRGRLSVTG